MSDILDKVRKLNWLLQESPTGAFTFDDLCEILSDLLEANVYVLDSEGSVVGVSLKLPKETSLEWNEEAERYFLPEALNKALVDVDSTMANLRNEDVHRLFNFDFKSDRLNTIIPIVGGGSRWGAMIMNRQEPEFTNEDLVLGEYGTTIIALTLRREKLDAERRDAREKSIVQLAIDTNIQQTVEDTLKNWTKYPSLRDPADKVYRSRNSDGTYTEIDQPQAACAVLDYRTGELLAVVGSRSEVTARKTLNRATDMKMPVGSSIKPISVYAPALELGASPASVVYNMPLPISGWKDSKGNDSWPKNYGGAGYTGPETLRTAMAKSHNTAAAQTLLTRVGVDRSVDFLKSMGVDDDHIDKTPFGLSLGSSGITPLQMTVAFGVLANGGVYQEPISVIGISDSHGDVVWDGHQHQDRKRVFSDSTSWLIVDMLKSVVSSGTGTGARIKGQTVGGKTGTNSDQKGVFFSGITGYYASALWIGHDNYKALSSKSTGSGAAAPLWQAYMSKIHEGLPQKNILDGDPSAYGLVKVTTCAVSGQLATEACMNDAKGYGTVTDYWREGTQPTQYCQMHQIQNVCAESGMPASPYCPNVIQRGVVSLQSGQYLASFLGTEYQSVLEEYMGLSEQNGGATCTWHGGGYQGGGAALPNQQAEDPALPRTK